MWNADLGYYYGKRFQFDAQAKLQNMLGENTESRIVVLSDSEEAQIRISFTDESKPAIEVLMSEFIDVKSPKAKGKRFSTLEIAKIEDITPAPVVEESIDDETADDAAMAESEVETGSANVDVPFTITNEVPEDSKPVDEQLSLF
jgi:topoisomerase-4 subunit A